MRSHVSAWRTLLAFVCLLAGCAAPPYARNQEVEGLVHAYRQQSARVQVASEQGVSTLTVEPVDGRPGEFLVTANLERAPLALVVRRLLEDTNTPHLILAQPLLGRVTARFEKHPFQKALLQLLGAHGYTATRRDGLTVINDAEPAPAPGAAPSAPGTPAGPGAEAPSALPLSRGVPLRYLDMDTATKFLEGLFPVDQRTGARPIAWAGQPYTSTLFVSGPRPDVTRALRMLDEMDRDPSHVLIEVLIVEFDSNELERFGTDLVNFVNKEYSALSSGVGGNVIQGIGAAPAALRFMYNRGANAKLGFEAIIDVLASQDKARTIARPYMATISGKQAAIQIQRERTVAVVAGVGGQVTSDTETVPSGVVLTITPWVLEDQRVRLDVQVEQSVFVTPTGNVLVEKDANKAQTTMQVRSGQSMIIGGLALQETFSSNTGLPWLRHIPLLNVLAAKQAGTERKQDVVVFVTPYVWVPTVEPPFPNPDAFKFREADELTAIEAWKRRWIKP